MANNQNNQQKGGLLQRMGKNNQSQQQNNTPQPSRFGSNNQLPKPMWTITPMTSVGVKIAYQGIGDPLFRILGEPLDKSLSDSSAFVDKISMNDLLMERLVATLDDAWDTYNLSGAVLFYPAHKTIQDAFSQMTLPVAEVEEQTNEDDGNSVQESRPPQNIPPPYTTYRAIDALFVLNILCRVRGAILVDETPVALETGFLNKSYICDDMRMVELALATGAIEESW